MLNKIRPEVYKRIVLAKALYKAGEAACATCTDEMIFTKGILLLHDAAETALGAVADFLNANLTGNRYLLQYYDLIKAADDPEHSNVPYRTQMKNLNTIRNDAKHQGILPNPKSNAHFPATVCALIEEICKTYLDLDFSSVSLKSLIRNKKILDYIDQAERKIEQEETEQSLISLAYAMYYICEESTIPWVSFLFPTDEEKEISILFTQPYKIEYQVKLIEHGIDPFLYYRFKNLTPEIVMHKDTRKLSYRWDKWYGHAKNWTTQNARFCLDFCIGTALKFQREEYEGYILIPYPNVFEDIIESIRKEATIWNQSSHPSEFLSQKSSDSRKAALTLKKGQSIIGWAIDNEDRLDEWFIKSKDIQSRSKEQIGFGFVLKSDVKVTPREIQVPKKIDDTENKQEKTEDA